MDIEKIITTYLKNNNFEGLCNTDAECGCNLDDLFPCDQICIVNCKPGYEIEDKTGEYSYIMTTKKPKK